MYTKQYTNSENIERRHLNDPNLTDDELDLYIREDEKNSAHRKGFLFLWFIFIVIFVAVAAFIFSL